MFYYFLAGFVTCALAWVYLRWLKVKNFWAERGVPHSPPNPILGSLTFLQKLNVGLWMRQMNEDFRTPYIGIWLFWRPALIINSPEIARRVLVKDFGSFRDRFVASGDSDPIGKRNLFMSKEPEWSSLRKRLTGAFTAAKLRNSQDFIRSKSKEFVQRIKREQKNRICLKSLMVDYTTDVIGTSAYGVACNGTLTGKDHIRSAANAFMEYSPLRGLGASCFFFFPELVDVFRFKFFPKPATDNLRKIFNASAAQRRGNGSVGESKDLFDALLNLRKENTANNEGYSDDTIIAQAAIFLLVGGETTGSLLTFILYELAFQQDIQQKLYEELTEAKKHNGSEDFTAEQLADMTYLNCVIKEALRKHAVMGWLDRVATTDYQIDDKLTIKAGTPVYVNAMGMHYNPDYFPEPKKFDPDRFLPENEKDIKPYTFMPFGEGPRNCIGQRFAFMTVRYAVFAVFLNYKVLPLPNTPKPEDVIIEKTGLFYSPGETLYVEFVPRT
ncbi:cytochrome P450 6k1-like [Maniola jurtina]|uniref:cytochrome P450 6k1-like n=1 Tax=Maniola jurtina TaxID=191418 RepID=UPI001E68C938|nr:cytochrome P450 6k1-like [Maniola jurtina]